MWPRFPGLNGYALSPATKEFTQRLIDAYAKIPKLANHLYLPAQHGSDRILSAMKRGYTALEYKSIIRRVRAVRPDITLSSDFIVGFPGETEADFEALMKMIEELNFDNSYSFVFSPRPGTPAANLADDTPQEVKLKRLQRLQALIDSNIRRNNDALLGTMQRIWSKARPSAIRMNCKAAPRATALSISMVGRMPSA